MSVILYSRSIRCTSCRCFRWEASLNLKQSIPLSSLGLFSGRTTSVCILFCRTFVCQFYFRILFTSVLRYAIGYTYLKYMDSGSLNDSVDHSEASSPPLMLNVSATLSGTTFKAGKAVFLVEICCEALGCCRRACSAKCKRDSPFTGPVIAAELVQG